MTDPEKIKIMMVDDHQIVIDGIKSLLRKESQFNFIADANNAEEALALLKKVQPDIVLTDINMPGMSGNELITKIKEHNPDIKVLVLSMNDQPDVISNIMMHEAEGYILKITGKQELISALKKIADGGTHYSKEVLLALTLKIQKSSKTDKEVMTLSERELEIIRLIVQEFTNEQIAEKLFISYRTVETHRRNINQKINVKTVVGLIKFAIRNEIATA